jgi:hypothetical protein
MRASTPPTRPLFLDMLLESKDDEGDPLPDEGIREEVDTFVFEGKGPLRKKGGGGEGCASSIGFASPLHPAVTWLGALTPLLPGTCPRAVGLTPVSVVAKG